MPEYEVWFSYAGGSPFDVVDEWVSLSYVKPVNDVGKLTLQMNGDYGNVAALTKDTRIGVYRDGKLELETTWLLQTLTRRVQRGARSIELGAESANTLTDRRRVAYDEGTSQASKVDFSDDMMKEVMRENFGTSASSFRQISNYLSIEGDRSAGPSISKAFPYDNVKDVLIEISQTTITNGSPVYFDIVSPTFGDLSFRTYRGLRGTDHSASGINPVILSIDRGNLADAVLTYDWTEEKTYIYGGGQEIVMTASSLTRINESAFGLREDYLSISGTGGSLAVQYEAEAELRNSRPTRTLEGEIVSIPGTQYGIHWTLGDKVTVEFEGIVLDCTVDAVSVSISGGKETIIGKLRSEES